MHHSALVRVTFLFVLPYSKIGCILKENKNLEIGVIIISVVRSRYFENDSDMN